MWSDLAYPWRVCLEEAWEAWCTGCVPIGAVILDAKGELVAKARNRISDPSPTPGQIYGHPLAHAEINALLQLSNPQGDFLHACTLYTLVEPCPLCFGALYMSGLRKAFFASRDPLAGSANLLGKTAYLSRKPIHIKAWDDAELERFVHAFQVAFFCEMKIDRYSAALKAYDEMNRDHSDFGRFLSETGWINQMRAQHSSAKSVYENLIFVYFEKYKKVK